MEAHWTGPADRRPYPSSKPVRWKSTVAVNPGRKQNQPNQPNQPQNLSVQKKNPKTYPHFLLPLPARSRSTTQRRRRSPGSNGGAAPASSPGRVARAADEATRTRRRQRDAPRKAVHLPLCHGWTPAAQASSLARRAPGSALDHRAWRTSRTSSQARSRYKPS
jgi:hypothetical protein